MPVDVFSDAELEQLFGKPELKPISGGQFIITNGWDKKNLIKVFIPQLVGVPIGGQKFSGNVTFHKKAAPQLVAGFEAIERAGHVAEILSYAGSFNPRLIAGTKSVSRHTYAIAIDVNAETNPLHKPAAKPGQKGSLHNIAEVLAAFGFGWGANFKKVDGMHFELIRLMTAKEIEAALAKFGGGGIKLIVNGVEKPLTIILNEGQSFARFGELMASIGKKSDAEHAAVQVPVRQFFKGNGYELDFDATKGPKGAIIATKA